MTNALTAKNSCMVKAIMTIKTATIVTIANRIFRYCVVPAITINIGGGEEKKMGIKETLHGAITFMTAGIGMLIFGAYE
jgi:hypothetical protein